MEALTSPSSDFNGAAGVPDSNEGSSVGPPMVVDSREGSFSPGRDIDPGAVAFLSFSWLEEDAEFSNLPPPGAIIGSRVEHVKMIDLPNLQVFNVPEQEGAMNEGDGVMNDNSVAPAWQEAEVNAFVIEREVVGSAEVCVNVYGLNRSTLEALGVQSAEIANGFSQMGDHSSLYPRMLSEDMLLLQMVLSVAPSAGSNDPLDAATTGARGIVHRKLRPLQAENSMFRKVLGFSSGEKVTAIAVAARIKGPEADRPKPQQGSHRRSRTPQIADPTPNTSVGPAEKKASGGQDQSESLQYDLRPDTAHSPMAWDMETESAVNARSKYDPFKKRRAADGRQLDAVTLQHLVSRLHDKSCDQRSKRRKDNEERVMRELGRLERRILTSEEQLDLGSRLHDKQRSHTAELKEKLKETYLRPLSPERKLEKEQQKEMAVRLHDVCMAKTKEDMKKLHQQYIEANALPKVRLTKEAQSKMADRLSTYHERTFN